MTNFDIKIEDKELQFQFNKLLKAGTDTRPLMQRLAQHLHFAVDENFEQQGRPHRWRPLSSKYAAWKRKRGFSSKILEKSGALRRSITEKYTNTEAIVGTNLKYAAVHQFGGRKMPSRPFMKVTSDDITRFTNFVKQYIVETRGYN